MDEFDFDYDTMTNIGASYSLTCTKLGKILKRNGLRTEESPSKPTPKAFELRMVKQRFNSNGIYVWEWHAEKTRMLLEHLGHKRRTDSVPEL